MYVIYKPSSPEFKYMELSNLVKVGIQGFYAADLFLEMSSILMWCLHTIESRIQVVKHVVLIQDLVGHICFQEIVWSTRAEPIKSSD